MSRPSRHLFQIYVWEALYMKFKVAAFAIIDGILLICATVAFVLGFIYAVTITAECLLLILVPAPVIWLHTRINKLCDKLQGLDGGE